MAVNVLGFDCAGRSCAAAVVLGGRVAAQCVAAMERGQTEALMPMIDRALREAGLRPDALNLVAVTTGPGSFTGIRIGIAAARGLALAAGVPAMGITSFAAVAASVPPDPAGRPLAVALDSRRDDIFLQAFAASGAPLGAPCAVSPALAVAALPTGALRLAGDAAVRLQPLVGARGALVDGVTAPDPVALARLAAETWRCDEPPAPPRPFYLRPPDTTLPRRRAGPT